MNIEDIKRNLGKIVLFSYKKSYIENSKYLFTGCIMRKNENGFYYLAELQDLKANSIVVTDLENIKAGEV